MTRVREKKIFQDTVFHRSARWQPGRSEMIVHLGHDNAELQAVTLDHPDYGSEWRRRDYDFVTSAECKKCSRKATLS